MLYYLSVLAIFKNEGSIINEWLEHYINEGVDHFYLIDNGSQDNYKISDEFLNKEEIIVDPVNYKQILLYNKHYLNKSKNESEWVIVVDLDEFIYAKNGTISDYLKTMSSGAVQIATPWKMFGSSGFIYQPDSVVNNFTYRCEMNSKTLIKCIVRTKYLFRYGMHHHNVVSNKMFYIDKLYNADNFLLDVDENILEKSPLHLNHYPIQSFEWFRKIKMTRGDASNRTSDNVRNANYFTEYDKCSTKYDNELRYKRYKTTDIINHDDIIIYGVGIYLDVSNFDIDLDKSFNEQFGDPVVNEAKYLILRINNKLNIINEKY